MKSADAFVQVGQEDSIHARDSQFSSLVLVVGLGRRVFLDDAAHLLLIGLPILLEQVKRVRSSRRDWMPSRISLMVMAGFQPSSSLRMDRQTVPEG
jgi:hypothetical protein